MKAMSHAMADRCENAKEPACHCRCGGALHGAKRFQTDALGNTPRVEFETLPETDPHFVPSKQRAKQLAKERAKQRKKEKRAAYWAARAKFSAPMSVVDLMR